MLVLYFTLCMLFRVYCLTVQIEQGCSLSYLYNKEFSLNGNLYTIVASKESVCCIYCKLEPSCVVWTWVRDTQQCTLKGSEGTIMDNINAISGRKYSSDNAEWILNNSNFSDFDTYGWYLLDKNSELITEPDIGKCGNISILGGVSKLGKNNLLRWKDNVNFIFSKIKILIRILFMDDWSSSGGQPDITLNNNALWLSDKVTISSINLCGSNSRMLEISFSTDVSPTNFLDIQLGFIFSNSYNGSWGLEFIQTLFLPDMSYLSPITKVTTMSAEIGKISVSLLGSDFPFNYFGVTITTLPKTGILSEEISGNLVPITEIPYNVTSKLKRVFYEPVIELGNTEFFYTIFSNSGKNMGIFSIEHYITEIVPFFCENNSSTIFGEIQKISSVNYIPSRINFKNIYRNPVVIADSNTYNNPQPSIVRIIEVDNSGFTVKIQKLSNIVVNHQSESISFIVVEAGVWRLSDGTVIEVGKTVTSASVGKILDQSTWKSVTFSSENQFSEIPIVLVQTQTNNDPHWVKARQTKITTSGFDVSLQIEDGNSHPHGGEIVGWISIEKKKGNFNNNKHFEIESTGLSSGIWNNITLSCDYHVPVFLAQMQTVSSTDSTNLRENSFPDIFQVIITRDSIPQKINNSMISEKIGYLIVDSGDLMDNSLYAYPTTCTPNQYSDLHVICTESKPLIINLFNSQTNEHGIVNIKTLPKKGNLYQYLEKFHLIPETRISSPNTFVVDSDNRVVYFPYTTFEGGNHEDTFTFVYGTSNIITVYLNIFPVQPKSPDVQVVIANTSPRVLVALLAVALIIIIIMGIAILIFCVFFYKKKKARKEIMNLFLGTKTTTGEHIYFPDVTDLDEDTIVDL